MRKTTGKGKSRLVCGACGHIAPIFRPNTKTREVGHIKHMYCPTCREERPFVEHTVIDRVEIIWALDAINTRAELRRASCIYSTETGEFLNQEEQTALLTSVEESLGMSEYELDVDMVIRTIQEQGYNVHVLKSYK